MAIPLFTGPAGSLPSTRAEDFSSAPELILRARESGANIAQTDQQTENLRQQTDLNDLRRQQAEFELQSEKELQPLKTEALRQKIAQDEAQTAAIQDKYAEEIRIRDKTQKLVGILGGADPQAKVGAVTSGQFADVFAADPKLEVSAIRNTFGLMSKEQQEVYGTAIQNNDLRSFYAKQAFETNQKYQEALGAVTADDATSELHRRFFSNYSLAEVPDKIKYVRSDKIVRNPETGEVTITPFAPQGKATEYTAFNAENGAFLMDGISPESYEKRQKFLDTRGLITQLGLPAANYSPASRTVTQLKQQEQQNATAAAPPPAPITPMASAENGSVVGNTRTGQTIDIGHGVRIPQRTQQQNEFMDVAPGVRVKNPNFEGPSAPQGSLQQPAPSSNTPDTNQAPVAQVQDNVLKSVIQNNPAYQQQSAKDNVIFRGFAEQLNANNKVASFSGAITDTAQFLLASDFNPFRGAESAQASEVGGTQRPLHAKVIDRVNSDPLLANKSPLIKALAAVESGGKRDALSPTGVRGLLQVTQSTAKQYGLDRNVPEENVLAGEKELYRNLKLVKTPELALAAYNAGVGTILDAIRATNSYDWNVIKDYLADSLPKRKFKEVQDYPERVLNYAAMFSTTPNVEV